MKEYQIENRRIRFIGVYDDIVLRDGAFLYCQAALFVNRGKDRGVILAMLPDRLMVAGRAAIYLAVVDHGKRWVFA